MNIRVPPHICVFNVIVVLVGMAEAGGRPYLRSNLARTMYHRMVSDERLRNMDLSKVGLSSLIVQLLIDCQTCIPALEHLYFCQFFLCLCYRNDSFFFFYPFRLHSLYHLRFKWICFGFMRDEWQKKVASVMGNGEGDDLRGS